MDSKKLRTNLTSFLKTEQILGAQTNKYDEFDDELIAAALSVAKDNKAILKGLYTDFRKPESSRVRKIKNTIIGKIANIVRNTIEKPFLSQQKYNEQIFYLINALIQENKKLTSKLEKLEKIEKSGK